MAVVQKSPNVYFIRWRCNKSMSEKVWQQQNRLGSASRWIKFCSTSVTKTECCFEANYNNKNIRVNFNLVKRFCQLVSGECWTLVCNRPARTSRHVLVKFEIINKIYPFSHFQNKSSRGWSSSETLTLFTVKGISGLASRKKYFWKPPRQKSTKINV